MTAEARSLGPGDRLAHVVPLTAMVMVVLNNQWWKYAYNNVWTGKLSDVGGLVFFPLLLVAALEVARGRVLSRRAVILCALATACAFTAVQLWAPATAAYGHGVGGPLWLARTVGAWLHGAAAPMYRPVCSVADPSDLLALPALLVALWVGLRDRP